MRAPLMFALAIVLFVSCQSQPSMTLPAEEFHQLLTSTPDPVVIDVRTQREFADGHLRNSMLLDISKPEFRESIEQLDKSKAYFVYCLSGSRSAGAARFMRQNGFKTVYELKGGLLSWRRHQFPLVDGSTAPDEISTAHYEAVTGAGLVLVDFFATWCGPCKKMEPMLAELQEDHKNALTVLRVDVDRNKGLVEVLGIEEIPVLKLYDSGKEVWNATGLVERDRIDKELEPLISR